MDEQVKRQKISAEAAVMGNEFLGARILSEVPRKIIFLPATL